MRTIDAKSYANSFLVFAILFSIGIYTNHLGFWKNAANASLMTAVSLISLVLFLGPLSRFFPNYFQHDLVYRKPMGIAGFVFTIIYSCILFALNGFDFYKLFSGANFLSSSYLALSLLTMFALWFISRPKSIQEMSFARWKSLQGWGYVAHAFLLLHFCFVDAYFFPKTITGKLIIFLSVLAMVSKIAVVLINLPKKHSVVEIAHLKKH
jgi:DMSO/TMAO reductase YedYZ heme-binding membrane subunit